MWRSAFHGARLADRPARPSRDRRDAIQLQCEVLRLQTQIHKLIALLRVLLVVLNISRFSLNQTRLPDGNDKRSLLRVIDRARSILPLRSVLRVVRMSSPRYHHWKRENDCALDDGPSCPRVCPHQLTAVEVEAIHSGLLHRVLAATEITYSNSMSELKLTGHIAMSELALAIGIARGNWRPEP